MTNSKDSKIAVPITKMTTNEYYFLLKLVLSQKEKISINGVRKSFFETPPKKALESCLKQMVKKNIINMAGENLEISNSLKEMFDIVVNSPYCLCFNNAFLKKNDKTLMIYYWNGKFVGISSDQKNTMMAESEYEDGIMSMFRKEMLAVGMSPDFNLDKWNTFNKFSEKMDKPVKNCAISIGFNRCDRVPYFCMLTASKHIVQILRGENNKSMDEAQGETVGAEYYYGVIRSEIEKLKDDSEKLSSGENSDTAKKTQPLKEKTDYEKIVSNPKYPKSLGGFVVYSIISSFKSLPGFFKGMVQNKFKKALLCLLWAVLLFFYNMYATCVKNDTFCFDRRTIWGNLTPYLMAGQISYRPSHLYGFDLGSGGTDTSMLVGPLMLVLSLLLFQIIRGLKKDKIKYVPNLVKGVNSVVKNQVRGVIDYKHAMAICAVAITIAFFVKNPITVVFAAVLLLLIGAQGRDNSFVIYCMMASCAINRKKVDAAKKKQPTFEGVITGIGIFSEALFAYSLVNLLLWKFLQYTSLWRIVITMLIVFFCILQCVMNKKNAKAAAGMILIFVSVSALLLILGQSNIVLADDGGWSESGRTILGLMHNAGFAIILGISIATIGFAIGGAAIVGFCIAGAVAGGGMFITGLTDTSAGRYVRGSANQFFGEDVDLDGDGEADGMTVLCMGVTALDVVTSFLNPSKGITNGQRAVYHGMKIAGDVVSSENDIEGLVRDGIKINNNDKDTGPMDIAMDVIGLGFDVYGFKSDIGDFKDAKNAVDNYGFDTIIMEDNTKKSFANLKEEKDNNIHNAETEFNTKYDNESTRHYDEQNRIMSEYERISSDDQLDNIEKMEKHSDLIVEKNQELNKHTQIVQDAVDEKFDKIADANKQYRKEVQDKVLDTSSKMWDVESAAETTIDLGKEIKNRVEDYIKAEPSQNDAPTNPEVQPESEVELGQEGETDNMGEEKK